MLACGLRVCQYVASLPRPSSRKWCFPVSLPGRRAVPHPFVERCGWPWSEAAAGAWGRRDGAAGLRRRQERGRRHPLPISSACRRDALRRPRSLEPPPQRRTGVPPAAFLTGLARRSHPEDARVGASLSCLPPAQALINSPASISFSSSVFRFFPASAFSPFIPGCFRLYPRSSYRQHLSLSFCLLCSQC